MWWKRTSYGKKSNMIKSRFVSNMTIQALILKLNNIKICFHPQNPTVLMVSFFCFWYIYKQHCTPKIGQFRLSSQAGKWATWTPDLLSPYSKLNFKSNLKKDEKNLKGTWLRKSIYRVIKIYLIQLSLKWQILFEIFSCVI